MGGSFLHDPFQNFSKVWSESNLQRLKEGEKSDSYKRCSSINGTQTTFITIANFDGIPEHFLMTLICYVIILVVFLILKKIAWMQQKQAECELLEVGDQEIWYRCGVDAIQYLTFHRYILYYMIINTAVCMFIVLPTNVKGALKDTNVHFERTTINNVDISSDLVWVHLVCGIILMISVGMTLKMIAGNLRIFLKSAWIERSIILKNIHKKHISSKEIEHYLRINFPSVQIEYIKLAYDYKYLIDMNMKLRQAADNLDICRFIKSHQYREVMVLKSGSFLQRLCKCNMHREMITGTEYYEAKVNKYKLKLAEEINRLPKKVLPIAFVTFRQEKDAQLVVNSQTKSFSIKMGGKWIFDGAPDPTNVMWENMQKGQTLWNWRSAFINLVVCIVAVFLSTPTIVVSSFKLDQISMTITEENVTLARFFITVILWILSLVIPAIVTYSSEYIEYKTKSSTYKSEMKKTVVFLILTVVILPSLGINSLSGFFSETVLGRNGKFDWSCLFFPDNGAFFVEYIFTSTFIGTPVQLIRLPDIFVCTWQLLTAKSEVERLSIRRGVIWDFNFGIQYSHSLLIFYMVTFFSLQCPVISIAGWINVTYGASALMWISIIVSICSTTTGKWKPFLMSTFIENYKQFDESFSTAVISTTLNSYNCVTLPTGNLGDTTWKILPEISIIVKLEEGRSDGEFGIAHNIIIRALREFQMAGTAFQGLSSGHP
ncbi:CSC1-like protein 2 [Caerostris darwini]|uniref:CSC1-like protein 2 n=1 Tax=Caerostris darwini TaxID=1538125 RepID=A0AAV4P481_9ARAC|nr:CSC1-like protein 2 [Caerostris darwini]